MKKLKNIALMIISILLIINIILLILINIPAVQTKILNIATSFIKDKTKTEIAIEHIEIDLFSGVTIDKIYIEDQKGDTLAYVGKLNVGTSITRTYLNNKLQLKCVSLSDFCANISKDSSNAPFNFQFLIDAFTSQDSTGKDTTQSKFDLKINDIILRNGRIKYDILSEKETKDTFNVSHILLSNLNADLSIGSIDVEKLSAQVKNLTFREKSGFYLKNLNAKVENEGKKFVSDLTIDLDKSHISLPKIELDYSATELSDSMFITKSKAIAKINETAIYPDELRALVPQLTNLDEKLSLEGEVKCNFPKGEVNDLNLKYGEGIVVNATASTTDVINYMDADINLEAEKIYADMHKLNHLITTLTPEAELPAIANRLEYADLRLAANGKIEDLNLILDAKFPIGEFELDGKMGYNKAGDINAKARLYTEKLELGTILDTTFRLGTVSMDAFASANIPHEGEPSFSLKGDIPLLTYNNRGYTDIIVDALYDDKKHADAKISLTDGDFRLSATAAGNNIGTDAMDIKLQSQIVNFSPYNLNLVDEKMKRILLSTNISLNSSGNSLDNLNCELRLDSTAMVSDSGNVSIKKVAIKISDNNTSGKTIKVSTPYLNLVADGTFNFETIAAAITSELSKYMPTFFANTSYDESKTKNSFTFDIKISDFQELSRVLKIPVNIYQPAHIFGQVKPNAGGLSLNADIPKIAIGDTKLSATKLLISDKDSAYNLNCHTDLQMKEDAIMAINVGAKAADDKLKIHIDYDNSPQQFHLKGELNNTFLFEKYKNDSILITAKISESDLTVNEFMVKVKPSTIEFLPKLITVKGFALSTDGDDFLSANGRISASRKDSMLVDFNDAYIEKLLKAASITDLPINGKMNGTINLSALMGKPRIFTKGFKIDNIIYKGQEIGNATISSKWSNKLQGMRLSARIENKNNLLFSADGNASTVNDNIDMNVSMIEFPISMAEEALKGTLHGIDGHCGADMKISGKLSAPDLNGYVFLNQTKATVDLTGVTYTISDTINFTTTTIRANKLKVTDNDKNKMSIRCSVNHEKFSNFKYKVSTYLDNFLILDNESMKDSLISGKLNLSGSITASGDLKKMTISGNLENKDKANVNIVLPESASKAKTFDNIVYKKKEDTLTVAIKEDKKKQQENPLIDISANIKIALNEKAKFNVIISQATGDAITFNGNCDLNANYEKNMAKLYGAYTLKEGTLKVKLAQMPTKTFSIKEGSQVLFNGDPMSCNVNINAGYKVKADLATLDPSFSQMGLSSTRVPVECALGITGNLKKFDINYDINLVEDNDDISRTVNSIITTDDLRIKEFAYLIGFGMFFAPNNDNMSGHSMLGSMASASISEALNSALSGIMGNKITIGTDMSSTQEDLSDLEMNLSVSTQLFNDRLILNTNVGYQTNNNASAESNNSTFIGDFEAQYKLTKNGIIRLKAFNKTNNEFHNISPMTQGIGILFVKESKNLSDLFKLKPTAESTRWQKNPLLLRQDTTKNKIKRSYFTNDSTTVISSKSDTTANK